MVRPEDGVGTENMAYWFHLSESSSRPRFLDSQHSVGTWSQPGGMSSSSYRYLSCLRERSRGAGPSKTTSSKSGSFSTSWDTSGNVETRESRISSPNEI